MKKFMTLALLMVGMTILAQERNEKQQRSEMEQFSPEQRNQLKLKEMTLHLDLNDSQQKEMSAIIAETSAKRESQKANFKAMKEKGVKPTADERFAMKSQMLDEQITFKKRVQKVLNAKQFEKWDQFQQERKQKMKSGMKRKQHQQPE